MDKIKAWWTAHKPTQRKLIQLYTALLYNANIKGFIEGEIYTGKLKNVCVPGFNCYSCPGAIAACPLGALQNAIGASKARFPAYILGILAIIGLVLGRVVCGFLCPLGWLQELLHKLPTPKIKKSRITRALSYLKYVLLAVFVICIPLVYAAKSYPMPAFCKFLCPAGTFEGAVGLLSNPANAEKFSMLNIFFTRKFVILIAIALCSVFLYRTFCRFLCPLGAIYGFFCRIALLGVTVDTSRCVDCGACVKHCKMDIRRVGDHECIQCGTCVTHCPTQAISWKLAPRKEKTKKKLRIAAWCVALALLIGLLVFVNRPAQADTSPDTKGEVPTSEQSDLPIGKELGMLAPDFTAPIYGGGNFTLSQHRGKITIVNFWATWCSPCVRELPYFDQLKADYGDTVDIIALHAAQITDDVETYLAGFDYKIPFALDETGDIIKSFGGSTNLPITIIIDADGVITYNKAGSVTYDLLVSQIAELQ